MLYPIEANELSRVLNSLSGRWVHLHLEVAPGGFLRNLRAYVEEAVIRCDGPTFRVALRCRESGWVVMEGLTHTVARGEEPFMLGTLVEEGRLTRVLQISKEAFAA